MREHTYPAQKVSKPPLHNLKSTMTCKYYTSNALIIQVVITKYVQGSAADLCRHTFVRIFIYTGISRQIKLVGRLLNEHF